MIFIKLSLIHFYSNLTICFIITNLYISKGYTMIFYFQLSIKLINDVKFLLNTVSSSNLVKCLTLANSHYCVILLSAFKVYLIVYIN